MEIAELKWKKGNDWYTFVEMEIAELKWKQGNAEIERNNYYTLDEINCLVECCSRK